MIIAPTPTAAAFEATICRYRLAFDKLRDPFVEDMHFPPMRTVLRDLGDRLGRPPKQAEFAAAAIDAWQRPFPEQYRSAIVARLGRAYASLIREWHFGLVLREVCEPMQLIVTESADLDMGNGIDFAVSGPNVRIGIAVQQATRRAWAFSQRKAWRRSVGWDVVTAELGFENRLVCGEFWLFRRQWIKTFVQQLV